MARILKSSIRAAPAPHLTKGPPGVAYWSADRCARFKRDLRTINESRESVDTMMLAARRLADAYGLPWEAVKPAEE
ncbi:MAG: hypothetical protein NDJ19_00605 [Ramlibacter sp.]|nr:hypothetical protein [Ramlibacter sp.]